MATSIELRQRRASRWEEAKSLHNLADKEKRQLTAEEQEQWDRINDDIDSLKITIDRMERMDKIDAEMDETPEPSTRGGLDINTFEQNGENFATEQESPLPNSKEYKSAFKDYLMYGLGGMRMDKRAILQPYFGATPTNAQYRAL